jgi:hypothetical protein
MYAEALRRELAALVEANAIADQRIEAILGLAREVSPGDRESSGVVLEAAEAVGRCEQARHGQLIQLLGQAQRITAHRAGLKTWVATHLDVSDGKARGIAEAAKSIGALPELAGSLSSGKVGADTVRALARTVKAVVGSGQDQAAELAATLETARTEGVGAANKRIRTLEHTIDPDSTEEQLAKQRAKSFLRVTELPNGMCRFDALLDPIRATVLRMVLDQIAADWIRQRQFDGTNPIPADVRSTEQISAQALVHLAEVFLAAPPDRRDAPFTAHVMYTAELDSENGLAETVYGTLVPRSAITEPEHPNAHLLQTRDGEPVLLDGEEIDSDPTARLASPAQRAALAVRDRHCTYPGCTRPPTWSLHAHHGISYRMGGATVMKNLSLLCSGHHTLTHHPAP